VPVRDDRFRAVIKSLCRLSCAHYVKNQPASAPHSANCGGAFPLQLFLRGVSWHIWLRSARWRTRTWKNRIACKYYQLSHWYAGGIFSTLAPRPSSADGLRPRVAHDRLQGGMCAVLGSRLTANRGECYMQSSASSSSSTSSNALPHTGHAFKPPM